MYSTWTQWMTAESDSQSNSSETQQRKVAESGSQHMAQGLNEEDGWVWLLTHGSGTQRRRWQSLALHKQLRDSANKVAESGSWDRTQPGPQDSVLDRTESGFTTGYIQRREKGSLAKPLGFCQLESWWAYEPHTRGSQSDCISTLIRIKDPDLLSLNFDCHMLLSKGLYLILSVYTVCLSDTIPDFNICWR